jgi:hypothetical protein
MYVSPLFKYRIILYSCLMIFPTFIGVRVYSVYNHTLNLEYNGTVQKITNEGYDHIEYYTISGKKYDLGYSYCKTTKYRDISVGDSLIKLRGCCITEFLKKEDMTINSSNL